jgi:UDP-N-acetylmuramoylalanine-D-glutamate ligase
MVCWSFQLPSSDIYFSCPHGAALNVTPEHLDRHYTFEVCGGKARLFGTRSDDFAVLAG